MKTALVVLVGALALAGCQQQPAKSEATRSCTVPQQDPVEIPIPETGTCDPGAVQLLNERIEHTRTKDGKVKVQRYATGVSITEECLRQTNKQAKDQARAAK